VVVRSSFFLLFLSENRPFFLHAAEGLRGLQFLKGRALLLFLLFSLSRAHAVASIETTFSLVLLLLLLFFFFFFFVFFLIVVVDRRSGGCLACLGEEQEDKEEEDKEKREKRKERAAKRRAPTEKKTTPNDATNFSFLAFEHVWSSRAKE
jgi:hypothetical protein